MIATLIILYITGFIYSWIKSAGWVFAYFQGKFPLIADEQRSNNFMFSILWSAFISLLWPIGIFMSYALTEDAEYGWKRPSRRQI